MNKINLIILITIIAIKCSLSHGPQLILYLCYNVLWLNQAFAVFLLNFFWSVIRLVSAYNRLKIRALAYLVNRLLPVYLSKVGVSHNLVQ